MIPRRIATVTACVRSRAGSLARMLFTWPFGILVDSESLCDCPVGISVADKRQDLKFAFRQRRIGDVMRQFARDRWIDRPATLIHIANSAYQFMVRVVFQ